MVAGCGNKCVKFALISVNVLICLAGLTLLGISLWANLDPNSSSEFNKIVDEVNEKENKNVAHVDLSKLRTPIWILVGVSAAMVILGFLGCCGAATENRCLLGAFIVFILILFLAKIGLGIAVIVKREELRKDIIKILGEVIKENSVLKKVEEKYECCGISDESLAKTLVDRAKCAPTGQAFAAKNCDVALYDELYDQAVIVGGVTLGILVLELLAMIFACILCNAVGKYGSGGYA